MGMKKRQALVLFSGGKDSFLTASRLLRKGYEIRLMSFNNGCVCGEQVFNHSASRLENRYGKEQCQFIGIYNTAATIMRLNEAWANTPYSEMGKRYPAIINTQLNCLHCQSAMWIAAFAYCIAKDIPFVACGYKSTDEFCTGIPQYTESIAKLGCYNNIGVRFPLWETDWDDMGRDYEMAAHGFIPSVYESKCLYGRPVAKMSEREAEDLMSYFHAQIEPHMQGLIENLIPVMKSITLSRLGPSMQVLEYPVPDGSDGLY